MILPPDVMDDQAHAVEEKPYRPGADPVSYPMVFLIMGVTLLLCSLPLFWPAMADAFHAMFSAAGG